MTSSRYFSELERTWEASRHESALWAAAPPPEYFVGLDLGQARDHTAIAVLERSVKVLGRNFATYAWDTAIRRSLRYLERLPLGLSYPEIVEHVREFLARPELKDHCTLIVDATGVGRPVVDMLRDSDLPCRVVPVTITGGGSQTSDGDHYRVPKRDLISGLVLLFQRGTLDICGHLRDSETLLNELANMRIKISLDGRESYDTWREKEHDDLVFAAALACWRDAR